MSAQDLFSVADQCELARMGISDVLAQRRSRSRFPAERLLEAAAEGQLTGPDLADPYSPEELPIQLDGREATEPEARALADLIVDGALVWLGRRITPTAAGRELLARWARYQRIGGEQG